MAKTLHLLRHAKSSWDDGRLTDHERPLSARGVQAAQRIAGHFSRTQIRPDLVLCSSAVRTQETLAAIATALGDKTEVRIEAELYGASEYELLARVRSVPDSIGGLLVIGHNPGIEDLAMSLDDGTDPAVTARLREKFPTGALITLAFRGRHWRDLTSGSA